MEQRKLTEEISRTETDVESGPDSDHGNPRQPSGVRDTVWRFIRTGLNDIVSKMREDDLSDEYDDDDGNWIQEMLDNETKDFIESIKNTYSDKRMKDLLKALDYGCTSEGSIAWENFLYLNGLLPVFLYKHENEGEDDILRHPFVQMIQSELVFRIGDLESNNEDLRKSLDKAIEFPKNLLDATVWITDIRVLMISRDTEHSFEIHSNIVDMGPVICRRHRIESDQIEFTDQVFLKNDTTKTDCRWGICRNNLCGLYLAGITEEDLAEYEHKKFDEDGSQKILIVRTFLTNLLLQTLKESVIDFESMADIAFAFSCHNGEHFKLYEKTWKKILEIVPQQLSPTRFSDSYIKIRRFDGEPWNTKNIPKNKDLVSITLGIYFVHIYQSALDTEFAFL